MRLESPTLVLGAAAGLMMSAGGAGADIFEFTGSCGDTGWFSCCVFEIDGEPVACKFDKKGDPVAFLFTNNWGNGPVCDDCGLLDFPGPGDVVIIDVDGLGEPFVAALGGGTTNVDSVEGDGELELTNSTLVTDGDLLLGGVTFFGGTSSITCGGVLGVGSFNQSNALVNLTTVGGATIGDGTFSSVTLNGGPVEQTGSITWAPPASNIVSNSVYTNSGTLTAVVAPNTTRTFSSAFVNTGTVRTVNSEPGSGVGTIRFADGPFDHDPGAELLVGEATRLSFVGGGTSRGAVDTEAGGSWFLGGFGDGYLLDSGTEMTGEGMVVVFRAVIPEDAQVDADACIVVDQNGVLTVRGALDADCLTMRSGSDLVGGPDGIVTLNSLNLQGAGTQTISGLSVTAENLDFGDAGVLRVDASPVILENVIADHSLPQGINIDSSAAAAEVFVNELGQLVTHSATFSVTGSAAGREDLFGIGGIWEIFSDTVIDGFVDRFEILDTGTVAVDSSDGTPPNLRVFAPVTLSGRIEVEFDATFEIAGFANAFDLSGGEMFVNGHFFTRAGAQNPANLTGAVIEIGPDGTLTFDADPVILDNTAIDNQGVARFKDADLSIDGDSSISGAGILSIEDTTVDGDATLSADAAALLLLSGINTVSVGLDINGIVRVVDGTTTLCGGPGKHVNEIHLGPGNLEVDSTSVTGAQIIAVTNQFTDIEGCNCELTFFVGFLLQRYHSIDALVAQDCNCVSGGLPDRGSASFVRLAFGQILSFTTTNEVEFIFDDDDIVEALSPDEVFILSKGTFSVDWAELEIGGTDHGDIPGGFDGNFELPTLRIGIGAKLRVVDLIDNANRGGAAGEAEAVYIDTLEFTDSTGRLDTNGLHVYFGNLIGDPSQIVDFSNGCNPADLAEPFGVLDFFDVLAFLGAFSAGEPEGDFNTDGVFDFFDVLEFLGEFSAGCP